MRNLLPPLLTAAALIAAPALAQTAAPPPAPASPPAPTSAPAPAEPAITHGHCMGVMGHMMDGKAPHQHSPHQMGHAHGAAKPLSEAERKQMREQCAAMMATDPKAPAQPK